MHYLLRSLLVLNLWSIQGAYGRALSEPTQPSHLADCGRPLRTTHIVESPDFQNIAKRDETDEFTAVRVTIAPDKTCGFISGSPHNPVTCMNPAHQCAWEGNEMKAVMCGAVLDKKYENWEVYIRCFERDEALKTQLCQDSCQSNLVNLRCTNRAAPYCKTYAYPKGVKDYRCAPTRALQSVSFTVDTERAAQFITATVPLPVELAIETDVPLPVELAIKTDIPIPVVPTPEVPPPVEPVTPDAPPPDETVTPDAPPPDEPVTPDAPPPDEPVTETDVSLTVSVSLTVKPATETETSSYTFIEIGTEPVTTTIPEPSKTIPPSPFPSSKPDSNLGAIIGGAVGGFAALLLIVLAIFWFVRRLKSDGTPGSIKTHEMSGEPTRFEMSGEPTHFEISGEPAHYEMSGEPATSQA